jgi:RNA polymerase sigma-70 factor, ECF subfamily
MTNFSGCRSPATRSDRRALTAQTEQADQQLLARVKQKDRHAFEQLYLDYHRRLARFLTRFTRNPADVEEIVNDTLLVVWTKASEFRGASRVSTWIFGIAYRRSLKTLRSAMRYERALQREALEADTVLHIDSQASEEHEAIQHALAQLTDEQRLVMEFAYFLGHSCAEIAEIVGAPVNTVKSRMLHARRKLQSILAKQNQMGLTAICTPQIQLSRS